MNAETKKRAPLLLLAVPGCGAEAVAGYLVSRGCPLWHEQLADDTNSFQILDVSTEAVSGLETVSCCGVIFPFRHPLEVAAALPAQGAASMSPGVEEGRVLEQYAAAVESALSRAEGGAAGCMICGSFAEWVRDFRPVERELAESGVQIAPCNGVWNLSGTAFPPLPVTAAAHELLRLLHPRAARAFDALQSRATPPYGFVLAEGEAEPLCVAAVREMAEFLQQQPERESWLPVLRELVTRRAEYSVQTLRMKYAEQQERRAQMIQQQAEKKALKAAEKRRAGAGEKGSDSQEKVVKKKADQTSPATAARVEREAKPDWLRHPGKALRSWFKGRG